MSLRTFVALLGLALSLLFRAQPSCAQMPCLRTNCIVGTEGVCGQNCYCASVGPSPQGVCVNR